MNELEQLISDFKAAGSRLPECMCNWLRVNSTEVAYAKAVIEEFLANGQFHIGEHGWGDGTDKQPVPVVVIGSQPVGQVPVQPVQATPETPPETAQDASQTLPEPIQASEAQTVAESQGSATGAAVTQ